MQKDKIFLFLILAAIIVLIFIFDSPRSIFEKWGLLNDTATKKFPVLTKGVYVTFRTAGNYRMDEILELAKKTELNALVIDVKDCTGRVPFNTDNGMINKIGSEKIYIKNIKELIKKIHDQGIYAIARIAVFEDNYLARERTDLALKWPGGGLWEDNNGLAWVDPAAQEVWDYNLEIAKEAIKAGFDEINFDYIRFPSDGSTANIVYPFWDGRTLKREVMRQFFEYTSQKLKPTGIPISVDLFGLTLTSTNDLNIGQWLENAALYFDYICPMVYPSHYPSGFLGFGNPAEYPYEIIYDAVKIGNERLASISSEAKIRPWLQDFDMGANYDARMIRLQKQAVYDAGGLGWLLWNPKNIYTEDGLGPDETDNLQK
jgi:hypothetical protein